MVSPDSGRTHETAQAGILGGGIRSLYRSGTPEKRSERQRPYQRRGSGGKSIPYVRYKDILSTYASGQSLYLKLVNGETRELYMSSFFDRPTASRLFGELPESFR